MKKYLMMMLVTLSLAVESGSDKLWKKTYSCIDPCGNPVLVFHNLENIILYDSTDSFFLVGYGDLKIDVAPNGCQYDMELNVLTTEPEFEATLIEYGFEIISD